MRSLKWLYVNPLNVRQIVHSSSKAWNLTAHWRTISADVIIFVSGTKSTSKMAVGYYIFHSINVLMRGLIVTLLCNNGSSAGTSSVKTCGYQCGFKGPKIVRWAVCRRAAGDRSGTSRVNLYFVWLPLLPLLRRT